MKVRRIKNPVEIIGNYILQKADHLAYVTMDLLIKRKDKRNFFIAEK